MTIRSETSIMVPMGIISSDPSCLSIMTLDTDLIEKESLALYTRYLKDPRIPEEACSEIYLEVVKRLKNERKRGTKRISGGHLGQVLKLAMKTVFHNKKNEKEHDDILTNIIESLNFFPSWARIEELTGQSRKLVSYAYHTVTKGIRDSFKDDTFWG